MTLILKPLGNCVVRYALIWLAAALVYAASFAAGLPAESVAVFVQYVLAGFYHVFTGSLLTLSPLFYFLYFGSLDTESRYLGVVLIVFLFLTNALAIGYDASLREASPESAAFLTCFILTAADMVRHAVRGRKRALTAEEKHSP